MITAKSFLQKSIVPVALSFSISMGLGGFSLACEPVWVRPVLPSSYASAFVGKVAHVDWLSSKITITPIKRISGSSPQQADVHFSELPWQCGHQSFHVGQIVDVFLNEAGDGWAQSPDQIDFGQSRVPR